MSSPGSFASVKWLSHLPFVPAFLCWPTILLSTKKFLLGLNRAFCPLRPIDDGYSSERFSLKMKLNPVILTMIFFKASYKRNKSPINYSNMFLVVFQPPIQRDLFFRTLLICLVFRIYSIDAVFWPVPGKFRYFDLGSWTQWPEPGPLAEMQLQHIFQDQLMSCSLGGQWLQAA